MHLFEKTRPLPYKQGELALIRNCVQNDLMWRGKLVKVFVYPQTDLKAERILLLHGWDGRSIMFRKLAQRLQKQGYMIVVPDLPAHGISSGKKVSFYELAKVVRRLEAYYGKFSIVIGHSTGGLISCMAALQGLTFKRMVLMSSPSSYGKMVDRYVSSNRLPARIAGSMKELYRLRYGVHPDLIGPELYKKIKQPVLILHDKQDMSISLNDALELDNAFMNSEVFMTDGKGHNGSLRDEAVFNCIANFVCRSLHDEFNTISNSIFSE